MVESTAQSAEDRLIARYFKPLAKHPGAFGLDDDAAAISPPAGCDLVLKTDGVIEGVHFFPGDPPDLVAKKVLRMNLSDLAAKGAMPVGFLLAIALRRDVGEDWLAAFARGLGEDADQYQCPLLGGDTDRTPGPVSAYVAAFGAVPNGTMVRRRGARPGDRVVVTGTIGDAALGLRLRRDAAMAACWRLDARAADHLTGRYLLPQPRNAIAEVLRTHARAAMDVSDGLAGDLAKLCRASGVSAAIEVDRVPVSDAGRAVLMADPQSIETMLTGGDDYEIVCAVSPDQLASFHAAAAAEGVSVTAIGVMTEGAAPPRFRDGKGGDLVLAKPSFSHF